MDKVILHEKVGYRILELNNGKVNAISLELLDDLIAAFEDSNKPEVKGILLAGRPNCFSAGLDIVSIATGGRVYSLKFWKSYYRLMQIMVNYAKPLVCAITGYAPAGATILTLLCDYRIMATGEKHVLGMHEFKMHLQVPEPLCYVYAYQLGEKNAWAAVQTAKLYHAQEAMDVGLVNEIAAPEEVLPRAEKFLKKQIQIVAKVYSDSKYFLRKDLRAIMNFDIDQKAEEQVEMTDTPESKMMVEMFLAQLKSKNK